MSSRLTSAIKRNLQAKAKVSSVRDNARLELRNQETERQLAYDLLKEEPELYARKLDRESALRPRARKAPRQKIDEDLELQDYLEEHPELLDKVVAAELRKEERKSKGRYAMMKKQLEDELDFEEEPPLRPIRTRMLDNDEPEPRISRARQEKPQSLVYSDDEAEEKPAAVQKAVRRFVKDLDEDGYTAYSISMEDTKRNGMTLKERKELAFAEADRAMKPPSRAPPSPQQKPRKKFDIKLRG
jgi:hypothetical protein